MSDLVKRLRNKARSWANKYFSPMITCDQHITWEAANEIERLQTVEDIVRRLIAKEDQRREIIGDPLMFQDVGIRELKDALEGKVPQTLQWWEERMQKRELASCKEPVA